MTDLGLEIYNRLKTKPRKYVEKIHCPLILNVMLKKGRPSAFCAKAEISDMTFYRWIKEYDFFAECYALGKMFARENWEIEGEKLRTHTNPPGVISHEFEHWKMVGWSRFGISKNSRIKLDLDSKGNPSEHYSQLLLQASNGDFTASEIKQLMEAINVGLNTHQVIQLQKEIDQLKSDLAIMVSNKNGHHTITDKGTA